ncbi:unnamed protein product [Didymodactylos carnosus]|uniref:Uncharacterized protein n=1 Tax=Didymodactylos carnosus TaxID=1234261 RepID=A0A814CAF9_9BILA|nr:unnamed protein product [Didymodactylos carnosus]CAF1383768.1 unnamed protein product [Didymodactylos carnosus]CAF3718072.1 unnamed protein product [Didymodactylos carnosus]CAF4191975.1 unnamed protein product [Didymodactylos carnosus]
MLQRSVSSIPVKSIPTHVRYVNDPLAISSSPVEPQRHNNHNSAFDNLNDDLAGLGEGERERQNEQQQQAETWLNLNAEQKYLETPPYSNKYYLPNSNDYRQDGKQQQPYVFITKNIPEYSNMLYGSYHSSRKLYSPVKQWKRSFNFNNNNNSENISNNLSQNPFASLTSNSNPNMGHRLSPSLKQMIETNPFARAWLALLLRKIVQEQPVPYIFKYGKK